MVDTVRAERLVAGGSALGRGADGRVVFVDGALPGELVEIERTVEKRDHAFGRVLTVLEPSPHRVTPPCPHRLAGCGGCAWMHLSEGVQLDAKADIVRESLQRIGHLDRSTVERLVRPGGSVHPLGYRTSIRIVGDPDGRPAFRSARSDRPIGIEGCLVAEPGLRAVLDDLEVVPGSEVDVRTSVATGESTLRARRGHRDRGSVDGGPDGGRRPARRERRDGGDRTIRRRPATARLGPHAWLRERVAGRLLRVSAASFFQSGPQAADLLVATLRDVAPEIDSTAHLLDAYGGVGLFAATSRAARVTVVESSRTACADAVHNLEGRDATVVNSELARWRPDGPAVDLAVADPARPGLGRPGVAALVGVGAPVLALVSCDPASLARDTVLLGEAGYRPETVVVVDLMPQTSHVETVVRFERSVTR